MYDENINQIANPSKSDKKAANSNRKFIITNQNLSSVDVKYDDNGSPQSNNIGIVVNNATAKWTQAQTENSLENINLTVIRGRLVGVIGPVGSGKVYINAYLPTLLFLIACKYYTKIIKKNSEFIITSDFTRITTIRRTNNSARCSFLCISGTVVICWFCTTKYSIWFNNGR